MSETIKDKQSFIFDLSDLFFRSGIMPLDLPKNTDFLGFRSRT
jgi:hypothetical protein